MSESLRAGRGRLNRFVLAILSTIPTLVVLACAAAIGWWGHHNEWKLPKFSALNGEVEETDDWCKEHSVPESICIECKPELAPKPKALGWCKIHSNPECVLCNPSLAQTLEPAVVSGSDLARAKRGLDFAPRPENNPICKTHLRRIQLADAATVEKAGITVEPVWLAPALEFVAAPGEIGYDQTKVAHLSSRSPGSVWRVFKHLGDTVKAGDVLALIDASEVGKAKAELLQAFGLLQLKTQTLASVKNSGGAVPEVRVREIEAALREAEIRLNAARQSLVNLGLPLEKSVIQGQNAEQLEARLQFFAIPNDVAKALDPKTTTSNLLPLVAPMDGVIVSRDVVTGEVVDSARILFELVDTRFLWLTLDVKGEDAKRLKLGQPVRFQSDSDDEPLTGKLAWMSTQADVKTRTVKVRTDIPDPTGKYRANSFGSGRVILREELEVVSVPNDAIQSDGCCQIVFVRDKDYLKSESYKFFHIRKIRTGAKSETQTEVIGILPGELVVVKGSGLLLTELLRGNLGEGCACHSK